MEYKTKLVRMNSYLRILSVWSEKSERYFGLCNILFYDENGVIVGTNSGHFDNDEELEFNGEVVRKLKVDFLQNKILLLEIRIVIVFGKIIINYIFILVMLILSILD